MPRPDPFGRWHIDVGAAVLLCLALVAAGARAAAPPMQEMSASAALSVAAQSMPLASDCRPCALCYVAPAPTAHTTTGEGKEPESATWWARVPPIPSTVRFLAAASSRVPVPIRIAFCRWLD